jgi:hypothetical protein
MKITESICWVLLDPEARKTISWSTWRCVDTSNSCWPYGQKCRRNPCAGYTVPRLEPSRLVCCHHKNFLLLMAGPCYSACKHLVYPSKLTRSNFPWSSPICRPLSISVFLVQSQRACLFCWAVHSRMKVFFVSVSRQKILAMKRNCPWIVCVLSLQLCQSNV